MPKYKSVKTGAVIVTASVIHSDNWIEVGSTKVTETSKPKRTRSKTKVTTKATTSTDEKPATEVAQ